ncbi:MAG: S-layer homology domain-containing protein [Oscillospiraceae bacterium]|nr:S-layer homology domain-containing protein [Oscillospiraceae bacterium]
MKKTRVLAIVIICIFTITFTIPIAQASNQHEPLTRGAALQLLFNVFYYSDILPPGGGDPIYVGAYEYGITAEPTDFIDVIDKPYAEAVIWAEQRGLVQGCGNRAFNGERAITRAEASMLIHRIITEFLNATDGIDSSSAVGAGFADYSQVPLWAIEAMSFSISNGYLNSNGNLFRPSATISKDEFAQAMNKLYNVRLGIYGHLVYPDRIDYSGVIVSYKGNGVEMSLGTETRILEAAFGQTFRNDWSHYLDGSLIWFMNNMVVRISSSPTILPDDNPWSFNGISVNSTSEDVSTILGEPNEFNLQFSLTENVLPQRDTATYYYNSIGESTDKLEEAVYFLEISYNADGSIANIVLSNQNVSNVDFSLVPSIFGVEFFQKSGSGNDSVYNRFVPTLAFDIIHEGTGEFAIKIDDDVLFSVTGAYSGRILRDVTIGKNIDIVASGDWSVRAMYSLMAHRHNHIRSGYGDSVFASITLYGDFIISHNGSGPFTVKWVPGTAGSGASEATIVDTVGAYSDIVNVDDVGTIDYGFGIGKMSYGFIVIEADGEWTFAPNFEFEVSE